MQENSALLLTVLILMSCYEYTSAIVYANKNYSKNNFHLKSSLGTIKNYVNSSTSYKLRYHNIKTETHSTYRTPMQDDNVYVASKSRQQQQQLVPLHHSKQVNESSNIFDPHQLLKKLKHTNKSSNAHLQKRHSGEYVAPSPSNSEMYPSLHHPIAAIIYKTATIATHATGNEPSPVTTESKKFLTSIKNVQPITTTNKDDSLIVNRKINYYDDSVAKESSNADMSAPQVDSKQFLYAPLRSSVEKELSSSSNCLPYPPSFIFITTTEATPLSYNPPDNNNNIPDFFTHRQYKSLWDSYIPSRYIIKILQHLRNKPDKNNLQTLAFSKQTKMKIQK